MLHIWRLGLNYLTASFNDYDQVAFFRLISPLPRNTVHYVNHHCTVSLIYYRLKNKLQSIALHRKSISTNNTNTLACMWKTKWAPSSEFVSSSIPSWQSLTAHAQPFRGARDLAFCLKVLLDSLLLWASSEGSGETARMAPLDGWACAIKICNDGMLEDTNSLDAAHIKRVHTH